jgi:hypothetical protein
MWTCESPLLQLDRHHRTYELSVDLPFCEFKAIEIGRERFRSGAANCEAIFQELGSVDWHVRVWINVVAYFMMLYCRVLFVLY